MQYHLFRRTMKFVATILLIMFCALLGAQTACATGWQVHGSCAEASDHEDHCESCHWDPCRLSYHSPLKSKIDEAVPLPLPVNGVISDLLAATSPRHPLMLDAPAGPTTPRPAGNFPLLI